MGDSDKPAPLHIKIAAGMTTGAFAIAVASPTDLVKVGDAICYTMRIRTGARYGYMLWDMPVLIAAMPAVQVRMQAEGKLPEGTPKRYPSAVKAYGIIVRCLPTWQCSKCPDPKQVGLLCCDMAFKLVVLVAGKRAWQGCGRALAPTSLAMRSSMQACVYIWPLQLENAISSRAGSAAGTRSASML